MLKNEHSGAKFLRDFRNSGKISHSAGEGLNVRISTIIRIDKRLRSGLHNMLQTSEKFFDFSIKMLTKWLTINNIMQIKNGRIWFNGSDLEIPFL